MSRAASELSIRSHLDKGLIITNQLISVAHNLCIPGDSESVSEFMDDESVNLFELAVNTDIRRASMHPNNEETTKPTGRKNKVYDLIKREIDARTKRPTVSHTGLFVDKSRNAAISGGDRDLKADVKSKQRRDRLKGQADAADEGDYLTFLTQGLYEMRSGSMEVKHFNFIQYGVTTPGLVQPRVALSTCCCG